MGSGGKGLGACLSLGAALDSLVLALTLSCSTLLVGRKPISYLLVDQLSTPAPNHLAYRKRSAHQVVFWCSQQPHQARRKGLLLETAGERIEVTTEYRLAGVGSGSQPKGDPESFQLWAPW